MKLYKKNYLRYIILISLLCQVFVFSGCAQNHFMQPKKQPVFYPNLPSKPKLQFLTSFSGPENLESSSASAFEKFILGESEQQEGIMRPYGLAFYDGKLYVCDIGIRMVEVFDLKNRTFGYLTTDKRLTNPINIFITSDDIKYVCDPTAGAVFVFDARNNLTAMLGKELNIAPIDVAVRDRRCYVSDFNSNQVVVIDITTDKEIMRIGSEVKEQSESMNELPPGQIALISDLTLDSRGNIYVTDKAAGRITKFDSSGKVLEVIGRLGSNVDEFIRPKGIAVDRDNRIWVVDSAPEVTKIYDDQARLLLYFGLPGNEPGNMNMPVKVYLDYDNIEYFRKYIVPGANIEFLVLVSNQYGLNKVNVYGFGDFQGYNPYADSSNVSSVNQVYVTNSKQDENMSFASMGTQTQIPDNRQTSQNEKVAALYSQSIAYYHNKEYRKARDGLSEVLNSGVIPPEMAKSIRRQLTEINNIIATDQEINNNADLYYRSITLYKSGNFNEARKGFIEVLNSGLIPPEMQKTIEGYLEKINDSQMNK